MATVFPHQFKPESAQYLTTNFPQFVRAGTNFPVSGLSYDATTQQSAYWKFRPISYGSGNWSIIIDWYALTATTGAIVWEAQLAAITPDTDTQDVETKALATLNFVSDTHLGTTAKRLHRCTITLSNLDSFAFGDDVWLKIARDADGTNATDDMAGFGVLTLVTISYSDT